MRDVAPDRDTAACRLCMTVARGFVDMCLPFRRHALFISDGRHDQAGSSTFAIWPVYQREPSPWKVLTARGSRASSKGPGSTCVSCRWITLATRARAWPESGAPIVLGRVLQQAARAVQLRGRSSLSIHSITYRKSMPSEGQTHINETWRKSSPYVNPELDPLVTLRR